MPHANGRSATPRWRDGQWGVGRSRSRRPLRAGVEAAGGRGCGAAGGRSRPDPEPIDPRSDHRGEQSLPRSPSGSPRDHRGRHLRRLDAPSPKLSLPQIARRRKPLDRRVAARTCLYGSTASLRDPASATRTVPGLARWCRPGMAWLEMREHRSGNLDARLNPVLPVAVEPPRQHQPHIVIQEQARGERLGREAGGTYSP
jgi:hypothetical protein